MKGFLYSALLLTFLAGTAVAEDREERINAAIPLSVTAQAALEELRRVAPKREQLAPIEAQFHTKMRLRALQCSQDYAIPPNLSNEEIRRAHGGESCYARADADIAEWLGLHTVGFILSLPPLRPLSAATPAFILDGSTNIQQVEFASKASIAVLKSYKDTEVVDLATGTPIFTAALNNDELLHSVSPNGRLYAASSRGAIRFYDAQDGALLTAPNWCMIMPVCGFQWLDDRSVMIYENNHTEIVDLRSGAHTAFEGEFDRITHLTAVPGASNEFVTFSDTGVMRFRLSYINEQVRIEVLQVDPFRLNLTAQENGGRDGTGHRYLNESDGKVYVTATDTLKTDVIDLGNFMVQHVVPTTDPDKIIVAGYIRGGRNTWTFHEYSFRDQKLAEIDTGRLIGTRFIYNPATNMLWVMKDAKLARVDTLTVKDAVDLKSFVASAAANSPERQVSDTVPARSSSHIVIQGGAIRDALGTEPAQPVPGPIADLAKDVEIQGIGVYEADNPRATSTSPGRYIGTLPGTNIPMYRQPDKPPDPSPAVPYVGTIKVTVKASPKPLMLVLSSFSKVSWQLSVERGARLKAILLTGPHGSSVSGQGDVRVVAIGNAFSYSLGTPEYTTLQNEVYTWTGKRIGLFQCGYQASDFSVAPL